MTSFIIRDGRTLVRLPRGIHDAVYDLARAPAQRMNAVKFQNRYPGDECFSLGLIGGAQQPEVYLTAFGRAVAHHLPERGGGKRLAPLIDVVPILRDLPVSDLDALNSEPPIPVLRGGRLLEQWGVLRSGSRGFAQTASGYAALAEAALPAPAEADYPYPELGLFDRSKLFSDTQIDFMRAVYNSGPMGVSPDAGRWDGRETKPLREGIMGVVQLRNTDARWIITPELRALVYFILKKPVASVHEFLLLLPLRDRDWVMSEGWRGLPRLRPLYVHLGLVKLKLSAGRNVLTRLGHQAVKHMDSREFETMVETLMASMEDEGDDPRTLDPEEILERLNSRVYMIAPIYLDGPDSVTVKDGLPPNTSYYDTPLSNLAALDQLMPDDPTDPDSDDDDPFAALRTDTKSDTQDAPVAPVDDSFDIL